MTLSPRPIVLLSLALLAGCGSSGSGEPSGPVETVAGADVRLTAEEYSFAPERLRVSAGSGPIRFTLANEGSLAHDIAILDGERTLGETPSFPGGEERSVEVDLEPGTYRYVCTVGDHEQLGMRGELVVGR